MKLKYKFKFFIASNKTALLEREWMIKNILANKIGIKNKHLTINSYDVTVNLPNTTDFHKKLIYGYYMSV